MDKGLIRLALIAVLLAGTASGLLAQDVYKTVDEDGNVVYTDQPPADGSPPMDLPDIPVIETDYAGTQMPGLRSEDEDTSGEMSIRELRKMYRDFAITAPAQEETFWGTANTVLVSWGASQAMEPGMNVRLFVDGQAMEAPATGSKSLTLERGEHQVYAELRDRGDRRVATTDTVTFFVKQHSVNFRRPRARP